jgi:fimbrial isopeptide formation D2 family protein
MIGKKVQSKIFFKIIISAVMLAFLFSMIGSVTPVMATVPVAYDDGYRVLKDTTLFVDAPGVLTYDYDKEGDPLTVDLSTYTQPANGSVTMYSNGSFTYIPDPGFVGNDSFSYNAIADEGTLTEEISNTATVYIVVYAPPIEGCLNDVDGANDVSGQGDMTKMCTDLSPANPESFGVSWNWDDISGSGANTYFACSLYDDDGDGNANYSICIQLLPDTVNNLSYVETEYYTCNDAWDDRCGQPSDPINVEYCNTVISDDDPFDITAINGPGDDWPNDYKATCAIPNTIVGGAASSLVNVCSYTSVANPNSNPADCIISTDQAYAFLAILKSTIPATAGLDFGFTINPATVNGTTVTTVTTGDTGVGASETFLVDAGTYSVSETIIPSGWLLESVSCTGQTSGDADALVIEAYDNVVCTFTNKATDISLVKADNDFPTLPGQTFDYTLTVNVETVDYTATNVVVTDDLDENLSFVGPFVVKRNGIETAGGECSYASSDEPEITCNLDSVAYGELLTITFTVRVGYGFDYSSYLEYDGVEMFGFVYPEITCGVGDDGDICNRACVAMDDDEADMTNNCDDEPKNVLTPTAVELGIFTVSGGVREVQLEWTMNDQTDVNHFNLYRDRSAKGKNKELINTIAFSPEGIYKATDTDLKPGPYYYWLEVVSNGETELFGPEEVKVLANNKIPDKVR